MIFRRQFLLLLLFEAGPVLDDWLEGRRLCCHKSLLLLLLHLPSLRLAVCGWPHQAEHDGEEEKAVEQAKDDDEEENLEEGGEDVGLGVGEEDEGEKGGEASVEHCRTNVGKGFSYLNKLSKMKICSKKGRKITRSFLEPVQDMKAWATWAE